jgi:hypothetical protein
MFKLLYRALSNATKTIKELDKALREAENVNKKKLN